MPVYPAAVDRLIPPGSNDPRIVPRVAILHVDAGDVRDLHDFFRDRSGGIESHFQVARDGTVFQYRDTNYQADANNLANDFAISIETQGLGVGEWTDAQLASIKALLLWLNKAHGIPLRKVDRWNGSGIGYHVLFGAPGPWTPVSKSCPGPDRIKQFDNVLVPWMSDATSPEKDDDMPYSDWPQKDRDALAKDVAEALLSAKVRNANPSGSVRQAPVGNMLTNIEVAGDRLQQQVSRVEALLTKLVQGQEPTDPKA